MSIQKVNKVFSYFEKYLQENDIGFTINTTKHKRTKFVRFYISGITECLECELRPKGLYVFVKYNSYIYDTLFDDDVMIKKVGSLYRCVYPYCNEPCEGKTEYEVWAEHVFNEFCEFVETRIQKNEELIIVESKGSTYGELKKFESIKTREDYFSKIENDNYHVVNVHEN